MDVDILIPHDHENSRPQFGVEGKMNQAINNGEKNSASPALKNRFTTGGKRPRVKFV
jgi:hypothetical protein